MRKGIWRTAVVAAVATGLLYPAAAANATGSPSRAPQATVIAAAALPPYSTWIADVTAVTDTAEAYLSTRLPDSTMKAAIVLDIDNTALAAKYHTGVTYPATPSVLALAKQARSAGAAIFFVTARPEIIKLLTQYNLTDVGYHIDGLYMRPTFDFESDQSLKTNARIAIEQRGYTIVANVGNSASDLAGGHAERTFKLPDYSGALN